MSSNVELLRAKLAYLESQLIIFGGNAPFHLVYELEQTREQFAALQSGAGAPRSGPPGTGAPLSTEAHPAAPENHLPAPTVLVVGPRGHAGLDTLKLALNALGVVVKNAGPDHTPPGRKIDVYLRDCAAQADMALVLFTKSAKERTQSAKIYADLDVRGPERLKRVVPLLDGATQDQAQRAVQECERSLNIAEFLAYRLSAECDDQEALSLASSIAQTLLEPLLANYSLKQAVTIDLFNASGGAPGGYEYPALLRLDWRELIGDLQPSRERWALASRVAQTLISELLGGRNKLFIRLKNSRLAPALLFGFHARASTGKQLYALQAKRDGDEIWHNAVDTDAAAELAHVDELGHPDAPAALLAFSLAQPIQPAVEKWVKDTAEWREYFQIRRYLSLPEGPAGSRTLIKDGAHARAIATAIRKQVKCLRDETGVREIYLTGSGPVALCALLGAELNAHTPIQWLDYDQSTHDYIPTCRLDVG